MSYIDARCSICGTFLVSWLTASGDNLVVRPCEHHCQHESEDKFNTDEDFEELNEET